MIITLRVIRSKRSRQLGKIYRITAVPVETEYVEIYITRFNRKEQRYQERFIVKLINTNKRPEASKFYLGITSGSQAYELWRTA